MNYKPKIMDLYIFIQLVLISGAATSAMTWFSYFMSKNYRKLYKEPVLLSSVLVQMNIDITNECKDNLGWFLHFVIGFLFVAAYHIIWAEDILAISALSALILGVISGIIGIISWMFIFKITHYRPLLGFRDYYIQLFFAHIIFTVVATALYFLTLILLIVTKAYFTI